MKHFLTENDGYKDCISLDLVKLFWQLFGLRSYVFQILIYDLMHDLIIKPHLLK